MKKIVSLAALVAILATACKKETVISEHNGEATLQFDARVGNADFTLNQNVTIGSRTYQFKNFRYWVSNLVFVKADGSEVAVPDSYYLLEETNAVPVQEGDYTYPARKREQVTVAGLPVAEYKQLKFSIGVDAAHNDNLSLQAGELSQLSGMTNISWMWFTSYIFTSIQGTVTEGSATKNFIAETGLNSNYKTVTVNLPANVKVSSAKNTQVVLAVDLEKILNGIDLIATPVIGASQAATMSALATNFAGSISVKSAE